MKIGMIVLAGGVGKRIGRPFPKQFLLLGGKPLIVHVLEKARVIADIERVVITCPEATSTRRGSSIANHGFDERGSAASSAERRARSRSTSASARSTDRDSVIIHEAVRPLVTVDEFRALIAAPDANAMFGIPIPFTVLKGHDYVEDLLERDELVNVQLPQKFDRAKLVAAHEAARRDGHVVHRGRQPVPPLRRRARPHPARLRAQHQDHRPDRHRDRRGDLRRRHRPRGLTMGKVCVITGASQGIGRAAAIRMSREPDVSALVLIARNADGLAETGGGDGRATGRHDRADPLRPDGPRRHPGARRAASTSEFGSIDILLNIAGYADPQSLLDTSTDNIVKTYTINVFAMLC